MKYPIKDLRSDFPDDAACLEWLVNFLYPDGITCVSCNIVTKHYPIKGRKVYSCGRCGHQVSPTAGTIFHKSSTPLTDWFHAIWLMSSNKAGTSAAQIQRELGVTYKTAWRMMHQIRKMMAAPEGMLAGEVEMDETFFHPNVFKRSSAKKKYGPTGSRRGEVVVGMVERRTGRTKVWHYRSLKGVSMIKLVQQHIKPGSMIYTDAYPGYWHLRFTRYNHMMTNHTKEEWVSPNYPLNHTQNVENLWSHFKRSIKGVYRYVSPQHLQKYADEFAWRYSHRNDVCMFWSLMGRVGKKL